MFMFLTAGHPSTPFWYFAVLASSSHPPAHNLLCTHQIGMASVRHSDRDRERERERDQEMVMLHITF